MHNRNFISQQLCIPVGFVSPVVDRIMGGDLSQGGLSAGRGGSASKGGSIQVEGLPPGGLP